MSEQERQSRSRECGRTLRRGEYVNPIVASLLVVFAFWGHVAADLPPYFGEVLDPSLSRSGGETREPCTIAYYNICSGYIHLIAWSLPTEETGVVFDLPADCQKTPGEVCTNTDFWWYWRYTHPGYGFTISYALYAADELFCKVGPPIGSLECQDPIERWNHYPGLGQTESDLVILIAMLDKGGRPFLVTDHAERNRQTGCAQPPLEAHSLYYGNVSTQYCPPEAWMDDVGFVNVLVDASFSCEATSVEPASWGAIKALFR